LLPSWSGWWSMQQPRRQPSLYWPPWEPQTSKCPKFCHRLQFWGFDNFYAKILLDTTQWVSCPIHINGTL
jgi:hypothetical protein